MKNRAEGLVTGHCRLIMGIVYLWVKLAMTRHWFIVPSVIFILHLPDALLMPYSFKNDWCIFKIRFCEEFLESNRNRLCDI